MCDENKVVGLAAAQKPEDFKVAVTNMLNDRLRSAISEVRKDSICSGVVSDPNHS